MPWDQAEIYRSFPSQSTKTIYFLDFENIQLNSKREKKKKNTQKERRGGGTPNLFSLQQKS